jgi:cyclohexadienyl dehydratase
MNSVSKAALCFCLLFLSAQLHAQSTYFTDAVQDATQVIELIDQRLALMPEVAAWKWRAQQPITDVERERQVLERSVADAEAIGLDGNSARRFFDVQIRMARAVQAQHFAQWQAELTPLIPTGRDLNAELRPALDVIGRDLLVAIYLASAELPRVLPNERIRARLQQLTKHRGVSDALVEELRIALLAVRINQAATLARIKRVGVLRVGTTGDYAPFSDDQGSDDQGGALRGFDIELAQQLAQHLGVAIQFVRTTWPTLMDDFSQHRFDIALSGISVTPERAARADFSTAYHVDGKTPIARCKDAPRLATLEQIDQPKVRVIVNPGGTNERFVRERIKRASIVVHTDNRTVFDEIIAGRADVMLTDGIEVALQVRRHPQLCGTMQTPLTQTSKAIMLPRAGWQDDVNAWLESQLQSGQVRDQLQRALRAAQ